MSPESGGAGAVSPAGQGPEDLVEDELAVGAEPVARSQWQLFRRRFFKHRLAVISLVVLVLLYLA